MRLRMRLPASRIHRGHSADCQMQLCQQWSSGVARRAPSPLSILPGCWKSSWRPPRRTCCARCPERDGTHCGAGQELLCAVEGEAGGHGGGEVEQEQEPEHLPGGEQRLHGECPFELGSCECC